MEPSAVCVSQPSASGPLNGSSWHTSKAVPERPVPVPVLSGTLPSAPLDRAPSPQDGVPAAVRPLRHLGVADSLKRRIEPAMGRHRIAPLGAHGPVVAGDRANIAAWPAPVPPSVITRYHHHSLLTVMRALWSFPSATGPELVLVADA